jgi:hypothetical protein
MALSSSTSPLEVRSLVGLTLVLMSAAVPVADGQWLNHPAPGIPRIADGRPDRTAPVPRMADGRPDLSGRWTRRALASDVAEADLLPWAQTVYRERRENFWKDGPWVTCLPLGPMQFTSDVPPMKLVQTSQLLMSLAEDLTFRQIFLDGRELPHDPNPSWMGYSVGRWDGDTLVVQSIGFTERSWLVNGYPHSGDLRITERYRRRDFGHMELLVTVDDSNTFRRPWSVTFEMELEPDTELLEYVCNENERSRAHMVGRLSDMKAAVAIDQALLEKYVGTYELRRPDGTLVRFQITREGGSLVLQRGGRAKVPLTALSETRFSGPAEYEFFRDSDGNVTHFMLGSVEGGNRAIRVR